MADSPWSLLNNDPYADARQFGSSAGLAFGATPSLAGVPAPQGPPLMGPPAPRPMMPGGGGPLQPNEFKKTNEQNEISNRKRDIFSTLFMSSEQLNAREKMSMGITPGVKRDKNGNILYKPEAIIGPDGEPLRDLNGRVKTQPGSTEPIYDPTQDKVDPNHPYQRQERGLNDLEQMNNARVALSPVGMDFRPLQELANYVTGQNIPGQAPRTVPWDQVTGMADEIQKRRADMVKSLREGIQNQQAGKINDLIGMQLVDKVGNEIGTKPYFGVPPAMKFLGEWQKYSQSEQDGLASAEEVQRLLDSNSRAAYPAIQVMLARTSREVGKIPQNEILRYNGSQDAVSQFNRAYAKWTTGRLTEQDVTDMRMLAGTYAKFYSDRLAKKQQYFQEQVGPYGMGYTPNYVQTLTQPNAGFGLGKPTPTPPAAPPRDAKADLLKALEALPPRAAPGAPAMPAPVPNAAPAPSPLPTQGPQRQNPKDALREMIQNMKAKNGS